MKKKIVFTVQLLFTVLLFYLIVQRWSISLPRLSSLLVKPGWLLLSFLISAFVIPLLAARRWQVILHFNGFYPSLTELLKINFSSIFWGTFLPSSDGFAAIRMYKIEKKYPLNHGVAGSTIVTEKLLGMFCLCLLGFLFSLSLRQIPNIAGIRRAISLLILIILIVCLLIFNQKLAAGFARLKPRTRLIRSIFSFIQNMQASLQNLPLGEVVISALPLVVAVQFCSFFQVYLLFKVLGTSLPLVLHLAFVPIIQLISLLPVTISGLGIREGAFVYFYGFVGVSPEIAFAVSLLNFLILNGIPALIGGAINLHEPFRKKEIS